MYEYLNGVVTVVKPTYLVLEVNGIGYKLLVGNPYAYQVEQSTKIYVEQVIRDTEQVLYGFIDEAEKNLFDQLTSVAGIGPKSALAILAANDQNGLTLAIANGDVKFLTKFPGVGKKTAQQIILDLKDKIAVADQDVLKTGTSEQPDLLGLDADFADGLAALAALGYSNKELDRIKDKLKAQALQGPDEYVRAGLKLLSH
ncbi:MAG TPA: Holliday junction branch migration protein RuvA [Lapidilactobacillus dextrinicus]|mgnify:CR=1 FL=1|jgi:Holliday junction DNA helicase RuvA|uniref:Holliday junction branch migration complex subunit RuvA n=2 Tax=Lapidilactobacillus dextrinicus TaxID=51664 RepID=A0A0R2BI87_9LACO|nr:Holliday junction branch migration protein RuvA [Lapidilactobacillus dextrinicus]KRM78242.1 Holliday junction DNA helicase RuvA [Lapidilactobacillus dextrinicus DSM 20335]QFG47193.1 Holliday junction branch migration protein RuvA [Lapidilactobacillus dextrinicus]HJE15463.1 Holliday junction branch migration protein RuvA [Lapidilactobacillus dextrinicus]